MFGRRRNSPFQPLGLRLQRFGRRIMRNYAPTDAGPTRPASVPVPSAWQESASEPLLWRSTADAPTAPAPAPQPVQAAPAPAPTPAAPPPPAPEPEVETGGLGDEANNGGLLAILAAHERQRGVQRSAAPKAPSQNANIARKLAEATQPTPSQGEAGDAPNIRGRRGRAAVDYVKTDTLKADMTQGEIDGMQRMAAPRVESAPEPAQPAAPSEDVSEASYTEIDDAGDIQRSADDSGSPTDMLFTPPAETDTAGITPTVSPGIQRMLDEAMTVTLSSATSDSDSTPAQPPIQRQAARGVPSQPTEATTPETPRTVPQPSAPIQRDAVPQQPTRVDAGQATPFTPAPRETTISTPDNQPPHISRAAEPSAPPTTVGANASDGTSVPFSADETSIQRSTEVQRLLDQAMTVTPSSVAPAADTPAAPTAVQRTAQSVPSASTPDTPIQRTAQPAARTPDTSTSATDTPIQRTAQSTAPTSGPVSDVSFTPAPATPQTPIQRSPEAEVQSLLDQALTVNPSSSAPASETPAASAAPTSVQRIAQSAPSASTPDTPIQRTAQPASSTPDTYASAPDTPIQRTPQPAARIPETSTSAPDTPVQRTPQPTAPTSGPVSDVSFTPAPATPQTPIQRSPEAEVQRLLDQAMTVNPSSSAPAAETPAASTAPTSVQRAAPPASSTPETPIQRTAQPASSTPETSTSAPDTPIQRTAQTAAPTSGPVSDVSFTPAPTAPQTPIQRSPDAEVQRLLDQALTVNPSSSVPATDTPATQTTPVQRTAQPATRTPDTPIQRTAVDTSRPSSAVRPTESTSTPAPVQRTEQPAVQREVNAEVQRLLDQALTVNPSSSVPAADVPAAPAAPTSVQRTAQPAPSASIPDTPIQRTADTPRAAAPTRPTESTSAPVQRTEQPAVQREVNAEVQRLLDQALTVNPSSSVPAANTPQKPAASAQSAAPIQRTADTPRAAAANRPTESASRPAPVQRTEQPAIQREANAEVQRLLDQALTVNPSSSAPAASAEPTSHTPSVQRKAEPATPAKPSVRSASETPASTPVPVQRTEQPAVQREVKVNAEVQRLLDQALTVNPSSSAPAADANQTSVQRQSTQTPPAAQAQPSIQRTPADAKPIQRSSEPPASRPLNSEVQRLLDQAMTVNPSSSTAPSQPAASTQSPIQRTAAPSASPTAAPNTPGVSPSIDPFNRTLSPEIQRRLDAAMRPSSDTISRTEAPGVESRRPFIPAQPPELEAPAPTPEPQRPVRRSAKTPAQTPAASTPESAAPANAPSSEPGSLEADLLRWMGMPPDTPVEGKLSRKPAANRSVPDLMRQAQTSTYRPDASETHGAEQDVDAESTAETPAVPTSSFTISAQHPSQVQRAINVEEVSSEVGSGSSSGGDAESSIDTVAQQVLDMLRKKLRLERERNRKF